MERVGLRHFAMSPPESITPSGPIFRIPTTAAISPRQRGCSAPGDPGTAGSSRPCTDQSGDAAHPYGNSDGAGRHYQALLHTNDFYQYLTLFKELGQKQTQQQSRGRKINAMDTYFYQMVERVLREELAVAFGESQQEAGRRLLEILR